MIPKRRPTIVQPWALIAAAVALVFALNLASPASADVDKKYDWKNKKRSLKVCLSSSTGCPAGMVDSLKAAISLWNTKLVSWTLTYTTDCATADIKVKCGALSGLGQWSHTKGSYGASEENEITINKDAAWGWCNDKHELVDALVHELGHAMRLNDVNKPAESMHYTRSKAGHKRAPTAADSTEAATADGTVPKKADTAPPGGKKLNTYFGQMTPGLGDPAFNLLSATAVTVTAFRPVEVAVTGWVIVDDNTLDWSAVIGANPDGVEAVRLLIEHGTTMDERWVYLHTVDPSWDETWQPTAVAPADTTVPAGGQIMLDATHSTHPAGLAAMTFSWFVDGEQQVIRGDTITRTSLPVGGHMIVLKALDEFGNESEDQMNVTVLPSGPIPVLDPIGTLALVLALVILGTALIRRQRRHVLP